MVMRCAERTGTGMMLWLHEFLATLAGLYSPPGDYIVPSLKNAPQCNTTFGGVQYG